MIRKGSFTHSPAQGTPKNQPQPIKLTDYYSDFENHTSFEDEVDLSSSSLSQKDGGQKSTKTTKTKLSQRNLALSIKKKQIRAERIMYQK